jgi:hypothetical protein
VSDGGQTVGFSEAIEQSGWGSARQREARRLCGELRKSLRCAEYAPDVDQVYKNLDSDTLVPDTPPPSRPASRADLLDGLLRRKPDPNGDLKTVADEFCHSQKMEGPEDPESTGHVLGRVWTFDGLNKLYQKSGRAGSRRRPGTLDRIISRASLRDQQDALGDMRLAPPHVDAMWSFYDPSARDDPLRNLPANRAGAVDILGLGKYHSSKERLVQWGHRLPGGHKAKKPTAWDAGVGDPHWRPGGRTRPLSANGGGTGAFSAADGRPEVVHAAVTGRDLAVKISFVVD